MDYPRHAAYASNHRGILRAGTFVRLSDAIAIYGGTRGVCDKLRLLLSEIYRGGIQSIPRGQTEAAAVLGMKKSQAFFYVTLPQVVKRIMPPMSNEIITLVKDTSLARVIGVVELIKFSEQIVNNYVVLWPLFYAGVFYLVFSGLLTLLFRYIEKKLDYYKV